jgi:hypothetical protein
MHWWLGALALLLCTACIGQKQTILPEQVVLNNCRHVMTGNESLVPPGPLDTLNIAPLLRTQFTERSIQVAHAFGLLDELQEHLEARERLSNEPSVEARLHNMETAMRVQQLLQQAALEVAATASELDCEKEHVSQIATFLSNRERSAETKLTVAAIVVGAVAAIATVLLLAKDDELQENSNAIEYVGIGAAVVQVGLGVAILKNERRVDHQHPRNVLREVWECAPVSTIVPPSIWYCLRLPDPLDKEHRTLLDQMVEKWKRMGQLEYGAGHGTGMEPIFFSDGGAYSSEDLRNRASMFDMLEAFVKLIHQDIERLADEVERLP